MSDTTSTTKNRILDAAERSILEHGFAATTVDAILKEAGASKGAFFHYFSSKDELGEAVVRRYAESDAAILEKFMQRAEATSDDPAEQVITFVSLLEEASSEFAIMQPGCLFVSFIYERVKGGRIADGVIVQSIELWRNRILEKLELAAASGRTAVDVDLPALADHLFVTFEGAFILARATGDTSHITAQVKQYRLCLELLLAR